MNAPASIAINASLGLAVFLLARALDRASRSQAAVVQSFAGGFSLAFVLLDLFVDLAEGTTSEQLHTIVRAGPEPIHTTAMLLLVGTLGTFLTAALVSHRDGPSRRHAAEIIPHFGYSTLIGAALVEEAREGLVAVALFWIAMAAHLAVIDHGFFVRFDRFHGAWSRLGCAAALLVGGIAWELLAPPLAVFHVVLAVVGGSTLLLAFRDEMPSPKTARAGAILAGAATFTLIEQVRWWL